MKNYKDILIDLHKQEREAQGEGFLFLGAPYHEQTELVTRARQELNIIPDIGYLDFLSFTNGLDYNGLAIYGTERCRAGTIFMEGFVEANQEYRQELALSDYIFYGDENTTQQVFNIKAKRFEIIDRFSWSVLSQHDCFDEMLLAAIKKL